MTSVQIKKFVDVRIQSHVTSVLKGTRNEVILFTPEGTASASHVVNASNYATQYPNTSGTTLTYAYLKVYFDNGGQSCKVYEGIGYSGVSSAITSLDLNSDQDHIVICTAVASADIASAFTALSTIASTREADTSIYGINEKIIVARTATIANTPIKNFAIKYHPTASTVGVEMTIAAYLSKIDVYQTDAVKDYSFTAEAVASTSVTDTEFENIITDNLNVNCVLAGATRNLGGNNADGSDLVNNYVRIILHQTLTEKLLALLVQKIKGSVGVSKIYTTICQELENYLASGYLSTDKIWTDDDYVVTENQQQFTIITKGTALTNGYVVRVLPFSALTTSELAAHQAPPIYVVLADQYGIRLIKLTGDVI